MSRTITVTRHVSAPPAQVFELFADVGRAAERVKGIERVELLTDGPVGQGTRFRETRVMFGKQASEEMEFTQFEPGRRYVVSSDSCGCDFTTTYSFDPSGAGTDVRLDMQIAPRTFMAKLMSPLSRLMTGTMLRCLGADMDDLQKLAEGETEAAQAQAG